MKLSTKSKYGLNACYYIGISADIISAQSLSKIMHVSEGYLEQILSVLKREGLIESVRGASGGYRLKKSAGDISIGDIVRPLEDNLEITDCASGGCDGGCPARPVWLKLYAGMNAVLDSMTLQNLLDNNTDPQNEE